MNVIHLFAIFVVNYYDYELMNVICGIFRASLPLLPEVFQPRVLFGLVLFAVLLLPEKRTQKTADFRVITLSLPCNYSIYPG